MVLGIDTLPWALTLSLWCRNLTYHFLGGRERHEYLITPLLRGLVGPANEELAFSSGHATRGAARQPTPPLCLSSLSGPEPSGLCPDVLGAGELGSGLGAQAHHVFFTRDMGGSGSGRSSPLAKKEGLWLPARTFCPMRAKKFQKKHHSVQPGRGGRGLPL